MTDTLRAELNRIETFLLGPEGKHLALILSALRSCDGPQAERFPKTITTMPIRGAAFPRLLRRDGINPYTSATECWAIGDPADLATRSDLQGRREAFSDDHFLDHLIQAADLLGILRP